MKYLLSQYGLWLFSKSAEAEFLVSSVGTKHRNNLYKWFVSIVLPLLIPRYWCTEALR